MPSITGPPKTAFVATLRRRSTLMSIGAFKFPDRRQVRIAYHGDVCDAGSGLA